MYANLGEVLNEIAAQINGENEHLRKVILTSYVLDRGKNSCNCYIFLREGKIYPIYLYNMIQ